MPDKGSGYLRVLVDLCEDCTGTRQYNNSVAFLRALRSDFVDPRPRAFRLARQGIRLFDFLLSPELIFFTGSLALVALIGLVELAGLGFSGIDVDLDGGDFLSWLGVGRVPLLVLLVALLSAFGLAGFAVQQIALAYAGGYLPSLYAIPAAAVAAVPATRFLAAGLARIVPRDETTAIDPTDLVGRVAKIATGVATKGSPARAQVRDQFGQVHNIMVEPDNAGESFEEGDQILLVRREAGTFSAILQERPRFQEWIES